MDEESRIHPNYRAMLEQGDSLMELNDAPDHGEDGAKMALDRSYVQVSTDAEFPPVRPGEDGSPH